MESIWNTYGVYMEFLERGAIGLMYSIIWWSLFKVIYKRD
jgi:hypothetical protein